MSDLAMLRQLQCETLLQFPNDSAHDAITRGTSYGKRCNIDAIVARHEHNTVLRRGFVTVRSGAESRAQRLAGRDENNFWRACIVRHPSFVYKLG